ncbi:MAG: hypothetical protein ACI4KF_05945 [Huintestinicola sp.]
MENNEFNANEYEQGSTAPAGKKPVCKAGTVLGIIGIIIGLFIPIIGLGCSVAGIIVSAVKKESHNVKTGLIVSIIGAVLSLASWVVGAMMMAALLGNMNIQ